MDLNSQFDEAFMDLKEKEIQINKYEIEKNEIIE